jgi:hypothetical protein
MAQSPYTPPQANLDDAPQEPLGAPPAGTPAGIGGWLLLPLIGLIISPIRVGILLASYVRLFAPQTWATLTTPGSAAYDPWWAPLLIFEVAANIVIIAFSLFLLWLFFRKSSRLPGLFVIWLLVVLGIEIVDVALASQLPAAADGIGDAVKELGRAAVGAAIWIPYFRKSVRVKNTFTRRGF